MFGVFEVRYFGVRSKTSTYRFIHIVQFKKSNVVEIAFAVVVGQNLGTEQLTYLKGLH